MYSNTTILNIREIKIYSGEITLKIILKIEKIILKKGVILINFMEKSLS